MINCIHHTAISTPDLERSIAFYRDLMDFQVTLQFSRPRGHAATDELMQLEGVSCEAAMLRKGNSMLELWKFSSPQPNPADPRRPVCDHGITHLCLAVDDVASEFERLSAAGMKFHCTPQYSDGTGYVYGRDPDGNVIELIEFQDPDHVLAIAD